MFHEFFAQTLSYHRIKATELSKVAGVSQNHISDFKTGKADVSSKVLWKLIEGCEELAPGARAYFCRLMAGRKYPAISLEELVESADDAEVEEILLALGRKWRSRDRDRDRNHKKEAILRV